MDRITRYLYTVVLMIMLAGCATTDHLTKTLRQYGYAPAIPAPKIMHIGDIYETPNLKKPAYFLMREVFPSDELNKLMDSSKNSIIIPSSSGEKTFKFSANADIIGKASVTLSKNNVTRFKVKFGDMQQYEVSKSRYRNEIYRKIKETLSSSNTNNKMGFDLNNKFVILKLLQAGSLEYEFYNEKGGKIEVKSGSDFEKALKAAIGFEWSANQNSNLSFSSPTFIGYYMGELTQSGADYKGLTEVKVEIKDIPVEKLRRAAK